MIKNLTLPINFRLVNVQLPRQITKIRISKKRLEMLFNDVIMTSLVHNYVDHGQISIPTRFQTNTPNNKVATVEGGGGGGDPPPTWRQK